MDKKIKATRNLEPRESKSDMITYRTRYILQAYRQNEAYPDRTTALPYSTYEERQRLQPNLVQ